MMYGIVVKIVMGAKDENKSETCRRNARKKG